MFLEEGMGEWGKLLGLAQNFNRLSLRVAEQQEKTPLLGCINYNLLVLHFVSIKITDLQLSLVFLYDPAIYRCATRRFLPFLFLEMSTCP